MCRSVAQCCGLARHLRSSTSRRTSDPRGHTQNDRTSACIASSMKADQSTPIARRQFLVLLLAHQLGRSEQHCSPAGMFGENAQCIGACDAVDRACASVRCACKQGFSGGRTCTLASPSQRSPVDGRPPDVAQCQTIPREIPLWAVHHAAMGCGCASAGVLGLARSAKFCDLSYWYGRSSDGKLWVESVSSCAPGCVQIRYNGVDRCVQPGAWQNLANALLPYHRRRPPPPPMNMPADQLTPPSKYSNKLYVAVLLDSRFTPNFVPIVFNVLGVLRSSGLDWRVQLFYTRANERQIFASRALQELRGLGQLSTTSIHDIAFAAQWDELNRWRKNVLLTSLEFWERVLAETVVIFHLDSVLCSGSDLSVASYLNYGYVGAAWKRDVWFRGVSVKVGNGGLSLRKRSLMLQCLSEYPYTARDAGVEPHVWSGEDIYFGWCARYLNAPVPTEDQATGFAVEFGDSAGTPLGVHGYDWDCCALPADDLERSFGVSHEDCCLHSPALRENCPEVHLIGLKPS